MVSAAHISRSVKVVIVHAGALLVTHKVVWNQPRLASEAVPLCFDPLGPIVSLAILVHRTFNMSRLFDKSI